MRNWYSAWWLAADRRAELLGEAERERLASQSRAPQLAVREGDHASLDGRARPAYGSRKAAVSR
jgi:hypothetical protein